MPISVVCPGCKTRFQVSEKFAGKEGPCPKCKQVIKVPEPDAVKIHVPEEFAGGGRDTKGKLVGKPIKRKATKVTPLQIAVISAAVASVAAVAWLAGEAIRGSVPLMGAGLLVISPPICVASYGLLRNDELEPHRGGSLWLRAAICAVVYVALWGCYAMLPGELIGAAWNWIFLAIPFLVAGGVAAYSTLDLTVENAVVHYLFYLLLTMGLRWLSGLPFVWVVQASTAT